MRVTLQLFIEKSVNLVWSGRSSSKKTDTKGLPPPETLPDENTQTWKAIHLPFFHHSHRFIECTALCLSGFYFI